MDMHPSYLGGVTTCKNHVMSVVHKWDMDLYDISAQIIARTAEATRQVAGISEVSP